MRRIGEVAAATGLTVRTLHHYDEIGLLAPSGRSDGGYRLYADDDVRRLYRIVAFRRLGFALGEIGALLDGEGADPRAVVRAQLERLDAEAAAREALRGRLVRLLDALDGANGAAADLFLEAIEGMTMSERYYTPEQLAQLEQRLAEDNRKFSRENRGSEKERRIRRARRTVGQLEEWVGKLNKAQVERVRQMSERVPLYDDLRERERKRVQAEFLAIVRAHEAQKRLPAFVNTWERGRDPALAAMGQIWRSEYEKMLIDIDRSLSAEQRAKAVARLRGFSEDFAVLASASAQGR